MERREADDSYRHVLKYTGIFGGVQGLKIFVTLARNKIASALLCKAGMGVNGIFLNIGEILNSWTNFGIPFYAVQRISELYEEGTDDDIRSFVGVIRTWSVWSAVLGGMLCFILASWLNGHYFPEGEQHTMEIMLLSFFVASMPIEAVECSLLKGLRQLRTVAFIETIAALSTFLITIPLYFFMGMSAIVVSLVLCGWTVAAIHLFFSTRIYPYRVRLFSHSVVREGWPLIRIGLPYVLAAVAGAMMTGEVFSYLSDTGQVGLYRAGYGLMVTYAGMVFVAVEADYFPRLSSINHDTVRLNHTVNQQIDVCVLLMAPILIVLVLAMPWVVRLLWTEEFLPVVPMAICAVFYMFFRAVTMPIAYTSLAKGDSWLYLIMECIYDVVSVLMLRWGYSRMGLTGAGIALSVLALFDLIMIGTVYGLRYHIYLRRRTIALVIPQGILLAIAVASCLWFNPLYKYMFGTLALLISVVFSLRMFSNDMPDVPVVAKLKRKMGL